MYKLSQYYPNQTKFWGRRRSSTYNIMWHPYLCDLYFYTSTPEDAKPLLEGTYGRGVQHCLECEVSSVLTEESLEPRDIGLERFPYNVTAIILIFLSCMWAAFLSILPRSQTNSRWLPCFEKATEDGCSPINWISVGAVIAVCLWYCHGKGPRSQGDS